MTHNQSPGLENAQSVNENIGSKISQNRKYRIVYMEIDQELFTASLLTRIPQKVMDKWFRMMKIQKDSNETYFKAWARYLCEINNLVYTLPLPYEIRDVILQHPGALRFMWTIANWENEHD